MEPMKKVSIIVPSYKRTKEVVGRALRSLLEQTYPNIEILLVDDNAKPEHAEYRSGLEALVAELASDRILYIQNLENLGGSLARNAGIHNASGEYVTFLDDDDRYLPQKVERQLGFMLENGLDMCFTDLAIHNEVDKLIDYREYSRIKDFSNEALMRYHLTRQIAGTNTFMYRLSVLKEIGGFVKVSMGQEYYLMYNTIQFGCKIGYLRGSDVILYREGQECISSGANKLTGQKELYAFKKKNFDLLNGRERRFVRFRHHVVMAIACRRTGRWLGIPGHAAAALFCSPADAFREFFGFFRRRRENGGLAK